MSAEVLNFWRLAVHLLGPSLFLIGRGALSGDQRPDDLPGACPSATPTTVRTQIARNALPTVATARPESSGPKRTVRHVRASSGTGLLLTRSNFHEGWVVSSSRNEKARTDARSASAITFGPCSVRGSGRRAKEPFLHSFPFLIGWADFGVFSALRARLVLLGELLCDGRPISEFSLSTTRVHRPQSPGGVYGRNRPRSSHLHRRRCCCQRPTPRRRVTEPGRAEPASGPQQRSSVVEVGAGGIDARPIPSRAPPLFRPNFERRLRCLLPSLHLRSSCLPEDTPGRAPVEIRRERRHRRFSSPLWLAAIGADPPQCSRGEISAIAFRRAARPRACGATWRSHPACPRHPPECAAASLGAPLPRTVAVDSSCARGGGAVSAHRRGGVANLFSVQNTRRRRPDGGAGAKMVGATPPAFSSSAMRCGRQSAARREQRRCPLGSCGVRRWLRVPSFSLAEELERREAVGGVLGSEFRRPPRDRRHVWT